MLVERQYRERGNLTRHLGVAVAWVFPLTKVSMAGKGVVDLEHWELFPRHHLHFAYLHLLLLKTGKVTAKTCCPTRNEKQFGKVPEIGAGQLVLGYHRLVTQYEVPIV